MDEEQFVRRLELLQRLLFPLIEEISEQQTLSIALESTLSAANHKHLLDEEKKLQERECICIHSVGDAHLKYLELINELSKAKINLMETYQQAIMEISDIKETRKGLHNSYVTIAKDQAKYAVIGEQKGDASPDLRLTSQKVNSSSSGVVTMIRIGSMGLKRPELADFAVSEQIRRRLERGNEVDKDSGAPWAGLSKNPFEGFSAVKVTPGLFGSALTTPMAPAQDVSESIEKVRVEIAASKENAVEETGVLDNHVESACNSTVMQGGGLKLSKGSLNGSLIENRGQSPRVPFEGKIPIDLTVNDEDTQYTYAARSNSSLSKNPEFAPFPAERKPELPKLYASDLYNAVRLVGPSDCHSKCGGLETECDTTPLSSSSLNVCSEAKEIKPPVLPKLVAADLYDSSRVVSVGEREILRKPPEMPKLYATDLYDASKILSTERPIKFGGVFKPVSPKKPKEEKDDTFLSYEFPKHLENYRKPTASNETFTVKNQTRVLEETSANSDQKGFSIPKIRLFTVEEYNRLKSAVRENLSLERLNSAVNVLNVHLEGTGSKVFTRKDLQKIMDTELDRCEALLFSSALSESGRLERLKPVAPVSNNNNFDTTFFAYR